MKLNDTLRAQKRHQKHIESIYSNGLKFQEHSYTIEFRWKQLKQTEILVELIIKSDTWNLRCTTNIMLTDKQVGQTNLLTWNNLPQKTEVFS